MASTCSRLRCLKGFPSDYESSWILCGVPPFAENPIGRVQVCLPCSEPLPSSTDPQAEPAQGRHQLGAPFLPISSNECSNHALPISFPLCLSNFSQNSFFHSLLHLCRGLLACSLHSPNPNAKRIRIARNHSAIHSLKPVMLSSVMRGRDPFKGLFGRFSSPSAPNQLRIYQSWFCRSSPCRMPPNLSVCLSCIRRHQRYQWRRWIWGRRSLWWHFRRVRRLRCQCWASTSTVIGTRIRRHWRIPGCRLPIMP